MNLNFRTKIGGQTGNPNSPYRNKKSNIKQGLKFRVSKLKYVLKNIPRKKRCYMDFGNQILIYNVP